MRRLLKIVVVVVLVVVLFGGGSILFLWATTPGSRVSEGWERLPNLPHPRGEVAAAVAARVDDVCPREPCSVSPVRLFVVGGMGGLGRVVRTVDVYNPETDRWTAGPELPEQRHHPAAAGAGGVLYVTGGAKRATNWAPERQMWILSPDAVEWGAGVSMPEGRMGHQMVALGAKLFVIGGRGPTANVLIYDTVEQTWQIGAAMPARRDHLGVAVVGTTIYAIGGRDTRLLRRVDVYDTAADSWSEGPPLPIPMSAMATGALDDGIHVVGGEDPATFGGGVIDRHYLLPTGGTRWVTGAPPIVRAHGAGAAVLNGRLVIAGGSRRQGSLSPLGWTGIVQAFGRRPA